MCRRAFEAGWAGASFKTICNFPQHEASPRFSSIRNHSNAFCGFKNIEQLSDHSVEENMQIFRKLREEFPTKVIIASIMGRNEDEWTSLPVLAKLTPNITDMVPMALAAKRGGADGIAAINTINSITDVDIDTLVAQPSVQGKSIVGGHQAIEFNAETRRPKLLGNRCVGCHLCRLVCSTGAIGKAGKAVYRPSGSNE